jgi:hypothetical protein
VAQEEVPASVDQPDIRKAARKIRNGWLAAILVNLLTLSGLMGWVYGVGLLDIFDVVLVFGLAFGIYKKSRACAAVMLVYFVLHKALFMLLAGLPIGILVSAAFVYLFVQGLIGAMDYRARTQPDQASEPASGA